jgi:hypothetical protein
MVMDRVVDVVHDMVMHMVMHDMVMRRHRSRLLRFRRLAGRRGRRRRLLGEGVSGKAGSQNRSGKKSLDHGASFLLERTLYLPLSN